jgi:ATP-dependent DNA helicase DinG
MTTLLQTVEEIFSPSGPFSVLPVFEYRHQQVEMSGAIARALEDTGHLIIEAPTGVGKTLAYLIPAILYALREGKRAVISTHTRNLQEQLLQKDIPLARKLLGKSFGAATLKGRRNYLCTTRLRGALASPASLFGNDDREELRRIQAWAAGTSDGDTEGLPFTPNPEVWNAVCSEQGICTPRTCGPGCFYQRAREKARRADVIILNHALFFNLLALQEGDDGYVFENDFVIFDEAHMLEAVAASGAGKRLSYRQLRTTLHRLYNTKTKKGLLAGQTKGLKQLVVTTEKSVQSFFDSVAQAGLALIAGAKSDGGQGMRLVRVRSPHLVPDILAAPLAALQSAVGKIEQGEDAGEIRQELAVTRRFLWDAQTLAGEFLGQTDPEFTYWLEIAGTRGDRSALCASPSDVSRFVGPRLFRKGRSVVLTSATLSVGGSLQYFQHRIGGTGVRALILDSPFDHRRQMRICIARDIPEPDTQEYRNLLPSWIMRSIDRTGGRALVLFTSNVLMRSVAALLAGEFGRRDIRLLVQGLGFPRHQLLEEFRRDIRSVLFGLDSFWMGIDVPGEALEHVIITRLPFAVPSHPLTETRLEMIARDGGNAFLEYSLPEAVLKFRQGAGRLIRSQADTGILTLLDSRILHKSYGRVFLGSLPRCPVELLSASGEVDEIFPDLE